MDFSDIRPAALAGTWYNANPQQLRGEVETFIQNAQSPEISGEIVALFAPHAGHFYSGAVAGHAFRAVQGNQYETIAIVSPYHRGHTQPLLTTGHDFFKTPLGRIPVDKESLSQLNEQLQRTTGIALTPVYQDQEHSIEIELPFLQVALGDEFQLLPVMIANALPETATKLGTSLAEVLKDRRSLLMASTDLSHFYPEELANQKDQFMLDAIATFDPNQVIAVYSSGKGQACGILPVLAVMAAARTLGANQAHIFQYATSGAVSGDYSRVVGYGAGAFTRPITPG